MRLVLHQYAVGNFHFQLLLVAEHLDVLQNLDALNLDVLLSFLNVVHLVHLDPAVVEVDVELLRRLRMDYFRDEVDVGLLHQLRMDYYQVEVEMDVAQPVVLESQPELLMKRLQLQQPLPHLVQLFQHRVMPLVLQDQRQVQRQVLQPTLD